MGAEQDSVTVSGFSSGSSIAMLMHVIYSDSIQGAGLIAGTPYGFGVGTDEFPNIADDSSIYIETAKDKASKSLIDPTSNLASKPVYIMGFDQDMYVKPEQKLIEGTEVFYNYFSSNVVRD